MEVRFDYSEKTQRCHLQISDNDVKERLLQAFSRINESKKFVKGYKRAFVKDRIYYISPTGTYNFGLSELIIDWLKEFVFDRTVDYIFSDSFKKRFAKDKTKYEIVNNLNLKLRDYQSECVELALKHHFGTFVLGTGAGKTLVIASILDNLFHFNKIKKALILVPDNRIGNAVQ